jgi:glycosyltransferase involved in cell wall biosynthesis
MRQPKVSVVVPAYNAASFLRETLDSILQQDIDNFEVIIADDGSTDATEQILAEYNSRVRHLKLEHWGGPSRPRNVGVQHARGEFVAFFDADDIMAPGALKKALAVLEGHQNVDLVFARNEAVDAEGNRLQKHPLDDPQDFRRSLEPTADPEVWLLSGRPLVYELVRACFIGACGVVVRREVLAQVGPFDEALKNSDDYDMWLRIAHAGHVFAFVDRVHFYYRWHDQSVSRRGYLRMPSMLRRLEKHYRLVTDPEDKRFLQQRMAQIERAYALGLREAGQLESATQAYLVALKRGLNPRNLTGLTKTLLLRLKRRLGV